MQRGTGMSGNRKANYLGVALLENESLKAAIHEVLDLSRARKESTRATHDAEGSGGAAQAPAFLQLFA
jgi:hypothetical protein